MFRMSSALDARNRAQLAGLFTDLPPRRPRCSPGCRPPSSAGTSIPAVRRGTGPRARMRPRAGPGFARPRSEGRGWPRPPPAPMVFPPGAGAMFTIGRRNDCDLRIADLSVSRLHAQLDRDEDGWLLSDLGSRNGTRVNGWLVRDPVPVRVGDVLQFGSAAFLVQARARAARTRADPLAHPPSGDGFVIWVQLESEGVTTVLLVRHGLTATTGHVLTGWTPGIPLDDRGVAQAAALAARLAPLRLDAIVAARWTAASRPRRPSRRAGTACSSARTSGWGSAGTGTGPASR